ncbi:MAG TPA: SMI1/KNR4 family protein [Polyangium sp.]|nr:SMI1/KNR4 family protein [Polyangium sp.]
MDDLWTRLGAWAAKNAGRDLRLRKGASKRAITAAEKKLSLRFPDDFRASLLLHDGQDPGDDDSIFEWMPGCSPLAPLEAIVERWKEEVELAETYVEDEIRIVEQGRLHAVLSHPKRIPIAGNQWWDGDNTFLDLYPAPQGASGQVITFVTECDIVVLGPSFRDALTLYVEALEKGDWVFSAKKGCVVPKKDKPDEYPNRADQFAAYTWKKIAKRAARA